MDKIEEMVETYINGNISDFKIWLKRTSKLNVLAAALLLENIGYTKSGAKKIFDLLLD